MIVAFIVAIIAIAYVVSPIDIIPDFIPVAGWLDDLLAIVTSFVTFINKLKQASAIAKVISVLLIIGLIAGAVYGVHSLISNSA